jgi:hypothetical protein
MIASAGILKSPDAGMSSTVMTARMRSPYDLMPL